jgi:uncharacterized protein (TIGR01777 family)
MKIVIAGAGGFIGRALASHFRNHQCVLLSRTPQKGAQFWDPDRGIIDLEAIAHADVVINLAGKSILGLWTPERKKQIVKSRVQCTEFLVHALNQAPPKVYVGASAVGYYGDNRPGEIFTENDPPASDFLAQLCVEWERAHNLLKPSRRILMRLGVVMDPSGGMLGKILPLFKLGLGGRLGDGQQRLSWIGLLDLVRAIEYCLHNPSISGPVNFCHPQALSNLAFTQQLAALCHRPAFMPVPAFMIKLILQEASNLLLGSLEVKPQKLLDGGFDFLQNNLKDVLSLQDVTKR